MDWPHAPTHWAFDVGVYMVTAGTYKKHPFLNSAKRLDHFTASLFTTAAEFGWHLQAWAVMSNHYHFVARTEHPETLSTFMCKLHSTTAHTYNGEDNAPGRRVWFQFWDNRITYEKSWLARLKYVHNNPVHHRIASCAANYRWCSAAWFSRTVPAGFANAVERFKTDTLHVQDDF